MQQTNRFESFTQVLGGVTLKLSGNLVIQQNNQNRKHFCERVIREIWFKMQNVQTITHRLIYSHDKSCDPTHFQK